MSDAKWKIIFTAQILLIVLIGGVISFRMGFFEDIKNDLIVDVNAETINMNNILDLKNKEIAKEVIKEQPKTEIVKAATLPKQESLQEVVSDSNEPRRVFERASDEYVKKIEEKFKDKISYKFITITTSYNSEAGQTDDSPCVAAKGMDLCKRGVEDIVATNDLAIHTKIMIPEYFGEQIFYVEDRMNERYTGTNRIDIWFKKKIDSKIWGAKTVKILVIKE